MNDTTSNSLQLDEAIKASADAAQKVEDLKKLVRNEDLKVVLTLIARHGFTQTDLKSVLKKRTSAKKTTITGAKRKYTKRVK